MIGHAFPKHKLNDIPWAATPRLRFTQGKKNQVKSIEVKSIESWKGFRW